jgi:hypothetical protein
MKKFQWQDEDLVRVDEKGNPLTESMDEALATNSRASKAREAYAALPLACYTEIDRYMDRAKEFLEMSNKGFREVASLTQTTVAEYMAFLDGRRIR